VAEDEALILWLDTDSPAWPGAALPCQKCDSSRLALASGWPSGIRALAGATIVVIVEVDQPQGNFQPESEDRLSGSVPVDRPLVEGPIWMASSGNSKCRSTSS
jgi:hypothetical protein